MIIESKSQIDNEDKFMKKINIGRVISISNYADIGVKWQSGGNKYGKAFCRRNHWYPLWPHCLGDPHPSCQYNADCRYFALGLADFVPFSFSNS